MTDIDLEDRRRELAEFANAAGQLQQPIPSGHAIARQTAGLVEHVIGAQPVAVHRDEQKIKVRLAELAAFAGTDWFYRFPVKNKDGRTEYIEGPSIKLANNVARIYGNNITEIRERDNGDSWTFYARFTDIETGFSLERSYRQRKSQATLKSKDADRMLDIVYQIGQSKALRNVIVNALDMFADYAFEHARNSLVDKIGKDLAGYRQRAIAGLERMPIALNRVERVIGYAAKDWLAPHVAQVIAMMKTVADGMASPDETFPPLEPAAATAATAAATAPAETQAAPAETQAPGAAATDEIGKAQAGAPSQVDGKR